jgi:hypothetical protein
MALVKCKECNKEISSQAQKCPNCGASVPSVLGTISSLLGAIALLFIAYSLFKFASIFN